MCCKLKASIRCPLICTDRQQSTNGYGGTGNGLRINVGQVGVGQVGGTYGTERAYGASAVNEKRL